VASSRIFFVNTADRIIALFAWTTSWSDAATSCDERDVVYETALINMNML